MMDEQDKTRIENWMKEHMENLQEALTLKFRCPYCGRDHAYELDWDTSFCPDCRKYFDRYLGGLVE
jgi:rubrerythrin